MFFVVLCRGMSPDQPLPPLSCSRRLEKNRKYYVKYYEVVGSSKLVFPMSSGQKMHDLPLIRFIQSTSTIFMRMKKDRFFERLVRVVSGHTIDLFKVNNNSIVFRCCKA